MNETIKNILGRRSVRSYAATPVKDEDLALIVECGLYAATGMGLQPWHFTVITDRKVLDMISAENKQVLLNSPNERMRRAAEEPGFDSFRGAPVAIIVSGEKKAGMAVADCANAVENMAIAAHSLGLGSCYLASFKVAMGTPDGAHLLQDLKIPEGYEPLFALSIGYADQPLGERAPRREGTVTYIR